MYIDRRYRPRRRRRSPWPFLLLLVLLAGAGLVVRSRLNIPLNSFDPLHPFQSPLPAATPTRTVLSYQAEAEDKYKAGRLAESTAAWAKVAEYDPTNDEAYMWQAYLAILRGHTADAVPLARKAVALKDSAMNLGVLAMALDWTEQYNEAIDTALKAVDRDPTLAEAHAFLAEVYADKNNWNRSLEEAQTAVKLNDKSPIAQRNMAYVLERQGRYQEAIATYEKAGQLAPYLGYMYLGAGNAYLAMGDYPNALAEYQKAVDANPDIATGYDALGHGSQVAGDPDRALAMLKKATQVDPTYAEAYSHLGAVYYTRLNYEAAIESFKKSVDLGLKSEENYYTFGLCYVYLDDCASARTWLQKALEINPESKPALDGLQLCQGK